MTNQYGDLLGTKLGILILTPNEGASREPPWTFRNSIDNSGRQTQTNLVGSTDRLYSGNFSRRETNSSVTVGVWD